VGDHLRPTTARRMARIGACRLHAAYTNVRVVRMRRNFAKPPHSQPVSTPARGDVSCHGAICQDDPAEIHSLLDKLDEGYDSSRAGSATAGLNSAGGSSRACTTR